MPTSNLLSMDGHKIVVDCGLGVGRALTEQGVPLKDLRVIFITHLHSDHYLELGPLIHTAWTAGLKRRIDVYGPRDLDQYWQGFLISMESDINLRISDEGRPDLRKLVVFHAIEETGIVRIGDINVTALRNLHPPLMDTFALSFKSKRKHVVFGGDTAFMPKLAEFAKGADLLIHEGMLRDAPSSLVTRVGNGDERLLKHLFAAHTSAADAAKIATIAQVKTLALNHLIPSDDPNISHQHWKAEIEPHWKGNFILGQDGLRIYLD